MRVPAHSRHNVVWLEYADQRLDLIPSIGGAVAAWRHIGAESVLDLWRPWSGLEPHPNYMACYPLVPWSNRISGGGIKHEGVFHPLKPNLNGEPFPIHGDGWQQSWNMTYTSHDTAIMTLYSNRFNGSPYVFQATQTFRLTPRGLDQILTVQHLGDSSLPYGLGLHPWFLRTPQASIQAPVQDVWLSRPDRLPFVRTSDVPPEWNLTQGVAACGSLIDNGFGGWNGRASLRWPEYGLTMTMNTRLVRSNSSDELWCILYRPPEGDVFCFEPVSHPIDAFNLPHLPGLQVLGPEEQLSLWVRWDYSLSR